MGKVYTVRVSDQHMTMILNTLAQLPYRDSAPVIQALASQMQTPKPAEIEQVNGEAVDDLG